MTGFTKNKGRGGFGAIVVIVAVAALALVLGGGWYVKEKVLTKYVPEQKACTLEAKLCPDGSAVGRTGPNCEFAMCLGATTTSTVDTTNWKTYRNEKYGFEVKYPSSTLVVEGGSNLPEDIIRGERLPSGTQFPTVGYIGIKRGDQIILDIDVYGNKNMKDLPSNFKWSDFSNYPSPISGDYDWSLRPCGQKGFNTIKAQKRTYFLAYKTLEVTSIIDFGEKKGHEDHYICINYPKNPIILNYSDDIKSEAEQILSTFKFTDSSAVFCGGIAGIQCPAGYACKLDGSYPDAGGICRKTEDIKTVGVLTGHVSIGPICPVERVDMPCPVPPEAYASREFLVLSADQSKTITSFHANASGSYSVSVPPGAYTVVSAKTGIGFMSKDLPSTVTIKAGQTTTLNIDVDTGIR